MPDAFSIELRSLLTGLLQRDVHKRLGCRGRGADEIKSHPFFRGIDWRVVYLQRLSPPLIPARGEVNAADAFDIGSFDDEDTKHIKLTDADQELYRNFPVVVSERWQHEIAETIFDYINHEADKAEMKRKNKHKLGYQEEEQSDCILHGYIKRLGGTFTATWLTRYVRLYPNRLELWSDSGKQPELIFMDQIEEVCNDYVQIKNEQCIVIKLYNHSKYVFTNSDEIGLKEWHVSLKSAHKDSLDMMTTMAEKATKIYGTEIPLKHMGKRRQQLQHELATSANNNSNNANTIVTAPTSGSSPSSSSTLTLAQTTTAGVPLAASSTNALASSAIANLEQKIIQKELQASAAAALPRSTGRPAASPSSGLEPSGQQQAQQHLATKTRDTSGHKHHRNPAHHQHRQQGGHHHRHHHHHEHGGASSSSTSGHHHHHHHHHHGHHRQSAAKPALAAGSGQRRDPNAPGVGVLEQSGNSKQPAQVRARDKPPVGGEQEARIAANETEPPEAEGMGALRKSIDLLGKSVSQVCKVAADSQQDDAPLSEPEPEVEREQTPVNREAKSMDEQQKRLRENSSSSIVDDEVSGASSTTSSCSSTSDDTANSGKDSTQQVDSSSSAKTQPNIQDKIIVIGAPEMESTGSAPLMSTGCERIKLAVSLENVTEQQEVLRDPSKRITSDNKQREQDLVAQYEKLNVKAKTSSSSIEE